MGWRSLFTHHTPSSPAPSGSQMTPPISQARAGTEHSTFSDSPAPTSSLWPCAPIPHRSSELPNQWLQVVPLGYAKAHFLNPDTVLPSLLFIPGTTLGPSGLPGGLAVMVAQVSSPHLSSSTNPHYRLVPETSSYCPATIISHLCSRRQWLSLSFTIWIKCNFSPWGNYTLHTKDDLSPFSLRWKHQTAWRKLPSSQTTPTVRSHTFAHSFLYLPLSHHTCPTPWN